MAEEEEKSFTFTFLGKEHGISCHSEPLVNPDLGCNLVYVRKYGALIVASPEAICYVPSVSVRNALDDRDTHYNIRDLPGAKLLACEGVRFMTLGPNDRLLAVATTKTVILLDVVSLGNHTKQDAKGYDVNGTIIGLSFNPTNEDLLLVTTDQNEILMLSTQEMRVVATAKGTSSGWTTNGSQTVIGLPDTSVHLANLKLDLLTEIYRPGEGTDNEMNETVSNVRYCQGLKDNVFAIFYEEMVGGLLTLEDGESNFVAADLPYGSGDTAAPTFMASIIPEWDISFVTTSWDERLYQLMKIGDNWESYYPVEGSEPQTGMLAVDDDDVDTKIIGFALDYTYWDTPHDHTGTELPQAPMIYLLSTGYVLMAYQFSSLQNYPNMEMVHPISLPPAPSDAVPADSPLTITMAQDSSKSTIRNNDQTPPSLDNTPPDTPPIALPTDKPVNVQANPFGTFNQPTVTTATNSGPIGEPSSPSPSSIPPYPVETPVKGPVNVFGRSIEVATPATVSPAPAPARSDSTGEGEGEGAMDTTSTPFKPRPAFGAFGQSTGLTTTAFGKPTVPTTAFGQPMEPSTTKPNAFSAFGQSTGTPTTTFGQYTAPPTSQPDAPSTKPIQTLSSFGQSSGTTTTAFGQSPSIFGKPAETSTTQDKPVDKPTSFGAFGQSATTSTTAFGQSPSIFGKPAETSTTQDKPVDKPTSFGAFGQSATTTTTAFGQSPSIFGKPAETSAAQEKPVDKPTSFGAFGQSTSTTTTAFGQSTSIFGKPTEASNTQDKPTDMPSAKPTSFGAFGQSTVTATSAFGKPAASPSIFGQPAGTSTNAFGQSTGTTTTAFGQSPSIFGKPTETSTTQDKPVDKQTSFSAFGQSTGTPTATFGQSPSIFGKPAETFTTQDRPVDKPTSFGAFGQSATTTTIFGQSPSIFGKTTETSATQEKPVDKPTSFGAFGQSTTTTTTAFDKPITTPSMVDQSPKVPVSPTNKTVVPVNLTSKLGETAIASHDTPTDVCSTKPTSNASVAFGQSTSAFGKSAASPSPFGQSTGTTTRLFGQSTAPASIFGKPTPATTDIAKPNDRTVATTTTTTTTTLATNMEGGKPANDNKPHTPLSFTGTSGTLKPLGTSLFGIPPKQDILTNNKPQSGPSPSPFGGSFGGKSSSTSTASPDLSGQPKSQPVNTGNGSLAGEKFEAKMGTGNGDKNDMIGRKAPGGNRVSNLKATLMSLEASCLEELITTNKQMNQILGLDNNGEDHISKLQSLLDNVLKESQAVLNGQSLKGLKEGVPSFQKNMQICEDSDIQLRHRRMLLEARCQSEMKSATQRLRRLDPELVVDRDVQRNRMQATQLSLQRVRRRVNEMQECMANQSQLGGSFMLATLNSDIQGKSSLVAMYEDKAEALSNELELITGNLAAMSMTARKPVGVCRSPNGGQLGTPAHKYSRERMRLLGTPRASMPPSPTMTEESQSPPSQYVTTSKATASIGTSMQIKSFPSNSTPPSTSTFSFGQMKPTGGSSLGQSKPPMFSAPKPEVMKIGLAPPGPPQPTSTFTPTTKSPTSFTFSTPPPSMGSTGFGKPSSKPSPSGLSFGLLGSQPPTSPTPSTGPSTTSTTHPPLFGAPSSKSNTGFTFGTSPSPSTSTSKPTASMTTANKTPTFGSGFVSVPTSTQFKAMEQKDDGKQIGLDSSRNNEARALAKEDSDSDLDDDEIEKVAIVTPAPKPVPTVSPTVTPTFGAKPATPTLAFGAPVTTKTTPVSNAFGAPAANKTPVSNAFGAPAANKTPVSNAFGAPAGNKTPVSNAFGAPAANKTPVSNAFGAPTADKPVSNAFGAPAANKTPVSNAFGAPAANKTPVSNAFGAPTADKPVSNAFGAPAANKTPVSNAFSAPAADKPVSNAFGAPAANKTPVSNAFGAPTANKTPVSNAFGAPAAKANTTPVSNAFGAPAADKTPVSNAFGAPAANAFGAPAADKTPVSNAFGAPAANAFGASSSSAFGGAAATPVSSGFGSQATAGQGFGSMGLGSTQPINDPTKNPFGGGPITVSTPSTSSGGLIQPGRLGGFGQSTGSTSGFGAKPAFGSSAFGTGFGAAAASNTGGFGASTTTTTGGFGSSATTTTGGFGAAAATTTGGFGVSTTTATGGFGASTTTTAGGFGAPPTFGSKPTFGTAGGFGASGFGATPAVSATVSTPTRLFGGGAAIGTGFGQTAQKTSGFGSFGGAAAATTASVPKAPSFSQGRY